MAIAAVTDARYKDKRKRDLERRIDEAKADLARVMHLAAVQESKTPSDSSLDLKTSPNHVIEALKSVRVNGFQLRRHERESEKRDAYLAQLHHDFLLERRHRPLQPIDLNIQLQEAAAADENDSSPPDREPQSPIQFSHMTNRVNTFVDRLLLEAIRLSYKDPVAVQASLNSLDSSWHAMKMLRSEGYPSYHHPDMQPARTLEVRREINSATRSIFADWRRMVEERGAQFQPRLIHIWVAKICYNILIAGVPPSIRNYDALLLGFMSVGQPTLAQVVADYILYQSRLRPTQQTVVCLLHHYRAKRDLPGFYALLRRFTGLDDRGLLLGRRSADLASWVPSIQKWASVSDVAVVNGWIVQRGRMDPHMSCAIIDGLISFDRLQHAARVFAACMAEYLTTSTGTLKQLIRQILDSVDVTAARLLVKGFVDHVDAVTPLLVSDDILASGSVDDTRLLIAMAATGMPSDDARSIAFSTPETDSAKLEKFARAMCVADMFQYLARLEGSLAQARRTLSSGSVTETADQLLDALDNLAEAQSRLEHAKAKYRRMATQRTIERKAQKAVNMCSAMMGSFFLVVSEAMPAVYQTLLRKSDLPFTERFASYLALASANSLHDQISQQIARGETVAHALEESLRDILLESLPAEEKQHLGEINSQIPLDLLVQARTEHNCQRQANEAQLHRKTTSLIDLVTRYPLFGFGRRSSSSLSAQGITP